MSLKTLITIKQLSLGLLRDMVASLWEPKSIDHAWSNPSQKPTNQAFNASDITISKVEEAPPEIKEKPYMFPFMEYFQTHPYKIYHLWLNLKVHWLKEHQKPDFPISLSLPNHPYK